MDALPIPTLLARAVRRDGRDGWLAALPALVDQLSVQWSLDVGAPYEPGGDTAWVAPATTASDEDVVLKVAWRHPEAEHEADGLAAWNGDGAVRLHDFERFDESIALVLERCTPGTPLSALPEPQQDLVIVDLLRQLWIAPPPDHPFRPLEAMGAHWADRYPHRALETGSTLDAGLEHDGLEMFRSLCAPGPGDVLLCTDLHAGNVVAAQRARWLAIDPKPHVGDPTYDLTQHTLNCARLDDDPLDLVERLAGLAGLDAGRLQRWMFARCVLESPGRPTLATAARRLAP